ncbi:MAG TPA: arylesterase [Pseudorhodoplanes sp.]|nr:arylesterase [Pseudorhodoplanes sp.]
MNWLFPMRALGRAFSYGGWRIPVQMLAAVAVVASLQAEGLATDRPLKIVAFGDSLTAGLGLPAQDTFPARLEQTLKSRGLNVEIVNAGVSGDTASGGLSRLDWSVPPDADAAIVELGANDALRGIDPKITREALEGIVARLRARRIEVLLCGMKAPRNLGADYAAAFDPIYAEIAAKSNVLLYPFFLDGVAADPKFAQADGMHPNTMGVTRIVEAILPKVEELIARVRAKG